MKELIINGKKSFENFGAYISERKISLPKKKSITESPPFSNLTYDFSGINGEIYWENRELEYSFDIAEFTTDEMEVEKTKLTDWLLNVHDADIYDPYIGDYHYHGSFDSISWEEDFGAGTLTATFSVYPYKIANEAKVVTVETASGKKYTDYELTFENNSSHRIMPVIESTGEYNIVFGGLSYSVGVGTYEDTFYLFPGNNTLKVTGSGKMTISFVEELF